MPRVITPDEVKGLLGNLARPNYFEMRFSLPLQGGLSSYLLSKGVERSFISRDISLFCNTATLPGVNAATTESYNYMGLKENFAHTRQYDDLTLEFYVDSSYKTFKFFQAWSDFSFGASGDDGGQSNYYVELNYPNTYKSDGCTLYKFENDNRSIGEGMQINRYQKISFKGLFPKAVYPSALAYDMDSQVMKLSVAFSYDRHQAGSVISVDFFNGIANDVDNVIGRTVDRLNSGSALLDFIN